MRILLDTCEFLWLVAGDDKLSSNVASAVRDPQNEVFLSAVSFWEISLKHTLGKLPCHSRPRSLSRSNAKNTLSRRLPWMKPPSRS